MIIRHSKSGLIPLVVLLFTLVLAPLSASAKGLFSPVVTINDSVITQFELQQRVTLLQVLRTAGNLDKEALQRLIDESLQLAAARSAGINPTAEQITAGIDEFAKRNEMTGAQFLTTLAEEGVDPASFRDFIKAGLAWRSLIRARFAIKANISDADIDRAIRFKGTIGSARVLISEIFLPIDTPENEALSRQIAPQIQKLRSVDGFSGAARKYSAGPSRSRGGIVPDWVPLENLPANIQKILLTMSPGQVTEPVDIPNAIALFQLRALQPTKASPAKNPSVDYAAYYIDGGQSETALARAAQVRAQVKTCDDLYGIAKNQPPEVLDRDEMALRDVPRDVAIELAKLDEGEVSTNLTRSNGETLVFLMLCARNRDAGADVSRDAVRQSLTSARLADFADIYLDELRANAAIHYP